jgi:Fe-S-cluster containining protein
MSENEWGTLKVVLKVSGVPLDLEMTVPTNPIKPHRMLPIFHQMANSFADIGVRAAEQDGKSISCRAGCGACCRQPVPISEIEAYQIVELVESMEEPRRSEVKERFKAAYGHFEDLGWFDEIRTEYLRKNKKPSEITKGLAIVHDYFGQGVPCPFLENESCSIHLQRPVSCREYLVTSSPEHCASLDGKNIEMVTLPVKPTNSLKKLGRTREGEKAGQLVLIQALRYVDEHPEQFAEKNGEAWMADFFGALTGDAAPGSKPSEVRTRRKKRHAKR